MIALAKTPVKAATRSAAGKQSVKRSSAGGGRTPRFDKSTNLAQHLVPLKPEGRRLPVFCFHPIDGQLDVYRKFVNLLDDDLPVYGLHAGASNEAATDIPELAGRYARVMLDAGRTDNYRLIGFSLGAILAMHVAAALEARGAAVEFVAVIDYCPITSDDWHSERECLADYIRTVHGHYAPRMAMLRDLAPEQLRSAARETAEHFLSEACNTSPDAIVEHLAGSQLFAEGVRAEFIRPFIQRLFARLPLMKTSRLRRLSASLCVWRARAGLGAGADRWSNWTRSSCEEWVLPADHLTVMQPPSVARLAEQLGAVIERFDGMAAPTKAARRL